MKKNMEYLMMPCNALLLTPLAMSIIINITEFPISNNIIHMDERFMGSQPPACMDNHG